MYKSPIDPYCCVILSKLSGFLPNNRNFFGRFRRQGKNIRGRAHFAKWTSPCVCITHLNAQEYQLSHRNNYSTSHSYSPYQTTSSATLSSKMHVLKLTLILPTAFLMASGTPTDDMESLRTSCENAATVLNASLNNTTGMVGLHALACQCHLLRTAQNTSGIVQNITWQVGASKANLGSVNVRTTQLRLKPCRES